jgi:Flp pilus assembly protein TadG
MPAFPFGGRLMRRFVRRSEGATAVEFALVAGPFFLMIMALLETALVIFVNAILENGMVDSARLIRTGQVHEQNMSEAEFRAVFCQNLITLVQCDERLMIDVRVFDSFNDVEFDPPLTPGGNLNDMNNFNPGTAGDIILVRAFYVWDGMTPIIGEYISNMAGGNRLVVSSAAFRNEPFDQILPSN